MFLCINQNEFLKDMIVFTGEKPFVFLSFFTLMEKQIEFGQLFLNLRLTLSEIRVNKCIF